jgi:hypothetical protein
VIIAADAVALYGLCAYGSNADADAVLTDAHWGAGVIAQDGAKYPGSRATDHIQHQSAAARTAPCRRPATPTDTTGTAKTLSDPAATSSGTEGHACRVPGGRALLIPAPNIHICASHALTGIQAISAPNGGYRVPPTRRAVTVGNEAPPAGLASKTPRRVRPVNSRLALAMPRNATTPSSVPGRPTLLVALACSW